MYKWLVTIIGGPTSSGTPYVCSVGPGSKDEPAIGNNADEAARNFFKRIKANPGNGGWGGNERLKIQVKLLSPLPPTSDGTFRNYQDDGSTFVEVD